MEEKIWDAEEARCLTLRQIEYLPYDEFKTLPDDVKDWYHDELMRLKRLSPAEFDKAIAELPLGRP
jgi:hypothetical protein